MALVDPRLAARAIGAGRVRALALELAAVLAVDPGRATAIVRARLREARHLHSAERRLVADGVFDLVRHAGLFHRAGIDDPGERWAAWVGWQAGTDDRLPRALDEAIGARDLAALAGVPDEVARRLAASLGDEAIDFALASNTRAPVVVRANRARIDRAALADRLRARGVETTPSPVAAHALRVVGRANLEGLPEFRDGLFEVQDDASQAVAALVPGGPVLDLCAGAGGKSLALAAEGVEVTAADVRPEALAELARRARRAGARIDTRVIRAEAPIPRDWQGAFAAVLVDAPCTGTGVWRRHPELRARAADADRFAARQLDIVARAAEAVARGGSLVYATCSVLVEEGEGVVAAALNRTGWRRRAPDRRWSPHRDGTDGFFAAVLAPPE